MECDISFRFAQKEDTGTILSFIRDLAEYEDLAHEVVATEAQLQEWIFEKKRAEVLFAMEDGREAGFALFFYNFSTFLGRAGLYLEDLYVRPECRGRGIGKGLLAQLAKLAVERDCGRLEWACLDWNQSSIDIYLSQGALPVEGWTIYCLAGENLQKLAEEV